MADKLSRGSTASSGASAVDGRTIASADDETREVDATVFALVPEYRQVKLGGADGCAYAITRKTSGLAP